MTAGSDPIPIAKVLAELISLRGYARVRGTQQLDEIWRELAGAEIADRTRVDGINRGVLRIEVGQSALLGELVSFHRQRLLNSLKANHPELRIRDIKFVLRSGVGNRSHDDQD